MIYWSWRKRFCPIMRSSFRYKLGSYYTTCLSRPVFLWLIKKLLRSMGWCCASPRCWFYLIKGAEPRDLYTVNVKQIRSNWIMRNKIRPALRHANAPVWPWVILNQIFKPPGKSKRLDAINFGWLIDERFDLQSLQGDLTHIKKIIIVRLLVSLCKIT